MPRIPKLAYRVCDLIGPNHLATFFSAPIDSSEFKAHPISFSLFSLDPEFA